ncbi:perlucin-like [Mytilus californianus]|uniref:perlucin-like n=1 Tax=Mytilus californianus TaxID=6549 RepID=UPI0022452C3D|nr:perlucin-like [Mytilus californianus]
MELNMKTIATLAILGLFIGNGVCDCPNGYMRHDDSCYKLYASTKATWAEAFMYCQVFGSDLAVIETAREQNFIEGFLRREFKKGMSDGVWIGGTDALVEGEWQWIKTGVSINQQEYRHWWPGEPNSSGALGEDCMDLLHHESYNWNDQRCDVHANFLCERPAVTGQQIIG